MLFIFTNYYRIQVIYTYVEQSFELLLILILLRLINMFYAVKYSSFRIDRYLLHRKKQDRFSHFFMMRKDFLIIIILFANFLMLTNIYWHKYNNTAYRKLYIMPSSKYKPNEASRGKYKNYLTLLGQTGKTCV